MNNTLVLQFFNLSSAFNLLRFKCSTFCKVTGSVDLTTILGFFDCFFEESLGALRFNGRSLDLLARREHFSSNELI